MSISLPLVFSSGSSSGLASRLTIEASIANAQQRRGLRLGSSVNMHNVMSRIIFARRGLG